MNTFIRLQAGCRSPGLPGLLVFLDPMVCVHVWPPRMLSDDSSAAAPLLVLISCFR